MTLLKLLLKAGLVLGAALLALYMGVAIGLTLSHVGLMFPGLRNPALPLIAQVFLALTALILVGITLQKTELLPWTAVAFGFGVLAGGLVMGLGVTMGMCLRLTSFGVLAIAQLILALIALIPVRISFQKDVLPKKYFAFGFAFFSWAVTALLTVFVFYLGFVTM